MTTIERPKRKLGLAQAPSRLELVRRLSDELRGLEVGALVRELGARHVDAPLKSTISLCPVCLRHVPALVFERSARVVIAKRCPHHGLHEAVLENDRAFYSVSNKDRHGRIFDRVRTVEIPEYVRPATAMCCAPGEDCGPAGPSSGRGEFTPQGENRSCTVLVEVTNACNLACRVCYSESDGDRFVPLDETVRVIEDLVRTQGALDSVQLTGGEATLHPRFGELVERVLAIEGIQKVFLPTNGLTLRDPGLQRRLSGHAGRLVVLLQFDALSRASNETIRRADPVRLRREVIAGLDALGIPMQLTMTLARGVNEHEVGEVVSVAFEHTNVKLIAMQPATSSGRFDLSIDPMDRLTLSDIAHAVEAQLEVVTRSRDFIPIPCSHPNCGWLTVFLRRFGMIHNVMRYVDLERVMQQVAYKTLLGTEEVRGVLGSHPGALSRLLAAGGKRLVRSTDMVSIAIKPFMDVHTYDQDRVANCCHHITDTHGQLRSFCEYNALDRRADSWERFPTRDGAV